MTIYNKLRFSITLALGALALQHIPVWAVDPPPWYVLRGSPQQQSAYIKEVSSESERVRAQVARRRFDEKKQYLQSVTTGLQSELQVQRQMLAAQLNGGQSSEPANLPSSNFAGSSPVVSVQRVGLSGGLILFLLVLYRFRNIFFGSDAATRTHNRALRLVGSLPKIPHR